MFLIFRRGNDMKNEHSWVERSGSTEKIFTNAQEYDINNESRRFTKHRQLAIKNGTEHTHEFHTQEINNFHKRSTYVDTQILETVSYIGNFIFIE